MVAAANANTSTVDFRFTRKFFHRFSSCGRKLLNDFLNIFRTLLLFFTDRMSLSAQCQSTVAVMYISMCCNNKDYEINVGFSPKPSIRSLCFNAVSVVVVVSTLRQEVELNRQKQLKSRSSDCIRNGVCSSQQLLLGNALISLHWPVAGHI